MSGTAALAAEELKRFAASMKNVLALADQLAAMDIQGAEANLARLRNDCVTLIANYRAQAELQAKAALASEVASQQAKAKAALEQAKTEAAAIVSAARSEAASIISIASKHAAELQAKVQAAHAAAAKAMQ